MSLVRSYLDHAAHTGLRIRYAHTIGSATWKLLLDPVWQAANLPTGNDNDPRRLRVVLLDTEDGKLYPSDIAAAWDDCELTTFMPVTGPSDQVDVTVGRILQDYFYAEYYCPCKRKQDAHKAGATVDEALVCVGSRFLIERLTPPDDHDLILLSEVFPRAELEEMLLCHWKSESELRILLARAGL